MKRTLLILSLFISGNIFAQKVKVLNFATFHMAYTPDAHKVEFDEKDEKNKAETYAIAKMLADFKPTVICVEVTPNKSQQLNDDYTNFLNDKNYKPKFGGEVALIAYEIGKIAGVKHIYAIDEQETAAYNYNIGNELENPVDSVIAKKYTAGVLKDFTQLQQLSTVDKLKFYNLSETFTKLINVNADILTYNSTKGNFEGADEASKFYRRNLRIYSNLNQIPVKADDRIFIIMGGTHTAFLNEFLKRSPKYELVNTADYLK
ncbi:DUF5694 domain-containing protein [Sphingobacterium sp. MYb382]|uniref:DUF5694 domain-containing protein n=1 Tax=Sphingobacterium sp. MYb382 TaxID=2745278 RepID=UPI0030B53C04